MDGGNTTKRNPPWSRDELILALDLYMRHRDRPPRKTSTEIADLSRQLNRLGEVLGHQHFDRYRNVNGVYMKLMNFRRLDPAYTSRGRVGLTRGGSGEELVWSEFADDVPRLRRVAEAIQENLAVENLPPELRNDSDEEITDASEGRLVTRLHRSRERNRNLVQRKKAAFLKRHGRLHCEACNFDPKPIYGERSDAVIECHHVRPLYTLRFQERKRLSDLALVCANCHRAIHATSRWLTVEEMQKSIESHK